MAVVHNRKTFFRVNAFFLAVIAACVPVLAQKTVINLDRGWEFRQQVSSGSDPVVPEWRPATVPGDVHLDLLANKLIPEPFYRDNEAKLQWIQDADWEYRTRIDGSSALRAREHVEIVFEGLDAYAEVYLNGQKVLVADNMFREWRVDVKPYLKTGSNDLLVVFPSPIKEAQKIALTDVWHGKTPAPDKTYIRKAAYEYGWDWGPTFVTSGIWRPAQIEAWDEARISDFYPHVRDVSKALARVDVELDIAASEASRGSVSITYQEGAQSGQAKQAISLVAGTNHIVVPIEIDNPHLWYPAGYGAQPIYHWSAKLNINGKTADEAARKTGLRSIVVRRDTDQWGRSFELVVNGIPVFAKGADVIPFDSFPSRVTTAQYRRILQSARDANMNMVRHWGGGYYETDEFYDICDELGIMVWQDFMFGNDWQPGPYWFRQNVEKEVEYQVTRLRNHPSIVIWCGNNETEISLAWDRNASIIRGLSAEERIKIWQDYLLLFSGTLPRVVERLGPETPYWPSSPSADYEDLAPGMASGDMHDWTVWHGRVPFSEYEKHYPRFMTEYGFQSFPEMKTIDAFTAAEDRTSIFTPVMLAHQKNNEGNSIIHDYLLKDYTEPKDFASFLYVSQVLQAEGIKIGAEHLRRSRPRTMGSIYWQLNDCWPVASWSSIDYYGRWKALQYYARRFYAPLLVSPHIENGSLAVYVVSDKPAPTDGELRVRILKFDGTVVREQKQAVHVPELSSAIYYQLPLTEFENSADTSQVFVAADLTVNGETVSKNLIYLAPTKLIQLPAAHIQTEVTPAGGGYRIHFTSPVLARSVYLSFGDLDAEPSDNYFDLLPNESVDITVKTQAQLDTLRQKLAVISLVDSFAPATTPPVAPQ